MGTVGHASNGWSDRLAGWFGGHAGLPIDGWLTTCCSQVGFAAFVAPVQGRTCSESRSSI